MKATPSPGRTVSAGAVLINFVHFERPRFDAREGEILAAYAQQLAELVGYLEITANDYEEATAEYHESLSRWYPVIEVVKERTGGTVSTDDLTPDELELHNEVAVNGLTVYLRIETFYDFAKILLNRLARLIPHYFGHADGVALSKHRQLPKALPAFAEQKGLELPAALTEQAEATAAHLRLSRQDDHARPQPTNVSRDGHRAQHGRSDDLDAPPVPRASGGRAASVRDAEDAPPGDRELR